MTFVHISLLYMSVTKQIALTRLYRLFNISSVSLFILLKGYLEILTGYLWDYAHSLQGISFKFYDELWLMEHLFCQITSWNQIFLWDGRKKTSKAAIQHWKMIPWKVIIITAWIKIIILSIIYWGVTMCWALCRVLHMTYFITITPCVKQ